MLSLSRFPESLEPTWAVLAEGLDEPAPAFDPATCDDLPEPARRWLTHAIPAGAPLRTTVELAMVGRIRLGPRWMACVATQILAAGVGFVWKPVVGGRLLRFVGADILGPDDARMEFRLHGLVPVARAAGPETARSAAGRLAAETVAWLPQAATPQQGARWSAGPARQNAASSAGLSAAPWGQSNAPDGQSAPPAALVPGDGKSDTATVTLTTPSGPIDVGVVVADDGRLTAVCLQRWSTDVDPPGYEPFGGDLTTEAMTGEGVCIASAGTVGWGYSTPGDANQRSAPRVASSGMAQPRHSHGLNALVPCGSHASMPKLRQGVARSAL